MREHLQTFMNGPAPFCCPRYGANKREGDECWTATGWLMWPEQYCIRPRRRENLMVGLV